MNWAIINREQEYNYNFLEFLKDKEFIEGQEKCYNNSKLTRVRFIRKYFNEYEDYCKVNGFFSQTLGEIENNM